eukprot:jgi/Bigna1/79357/fgenesh1_pg.61_\
MSPGWLDWFDFQASEGPELFVDLTLSGRALESMGRRKRRDFKNHLPKHDHPARAWLEWNIEKMCWISQGSHGCFTSFNGNYAATRSTLIARVGSGWKMSRRAGYAASNGGYNSNQLTDYADQMRRKRENAERIREQRKMRLEREAAQRNDGTFGEPPAIPSRQSRRQSAVPPGYDQPSSAGYSNGGVSSRNYQQHYSSSSHHHDSSNNSRNESIVAAIPILQSLEEQLRLLRHQQKLFIAFMQTANKKFIFLENQFEDFKREGKTAQKGGSGGMQQSTTRVLLMVTPGGVTYSSSSPKDSAAADHQKGGGYYDDYNNSAAGGGDVDVRNGGGGRGRGGDTGSGYRSSSHQQHQQQTSQPSSARRRAEAQEYATKYEQQQKQKQRQERENSRNNMMQQQYHQQAGGYDDSQFNGQGKHDDGLPDAFAEEPVNLEPCPNCGRKFKPEVLARHIQKGVCKKKKRRAFKVKRVEEKVKKDVTSEQNYEAAKAKKKAMPKWKRDREALRAALKQGKMITQALKEGRDIRDVPVVPSSAAQDDRVPCPHCGRKFNEDVAARHIPRCKNIRAKPKRLIAKKHQYGGVARRGSRR